MVKVLTGSGKDHCRNCNTNVVHSIRVFVIEIPLFMMFDCDHCVDGSRRSRITAAHCSRR